MGRITLQGNFAGGKVVFLPNRVRVYFFVHNTGATENESVVEQSTKLSIKESSKLWSIQKYSLKRIFFNLYLFHFVF